MTSNSGVRSIAVGVDGSPASVDALVWAGGLARASSARVTVVSTWQMPLVASLPSVIGGLPTEEFMAQQSEENLANTVARAGLDLEPETRVVHGDPGEVLVELSGEVDLVVVGRTGSGRRHGLARAAEIVLGSTARHCINHAHGPVAVVPLGHRWVENAAVVVGVDGSDASDAALRWAAERLPEGSALHVIRSVPPFLEGLLAIDRSAIDRIVSETERELEAAADKALAAVPGDRRDRVRTQVVVENARYALTKPDHPVDLIVVGARGRNALAARMLGSITDHVVRNANCPVVVVPPAGGMQ